MFLFEQMFNTALNGINSAGLMSTILTVAYGILLASLLFSAYEAWVRGGDVRALGVSAVKYLALGLLFLNGGAVYDSVVRAVLGAFNQIAHTMAGAGPNDVFTNWKTELVAAASSGTFLNVITGSIAGLLSALLLLIATILYPVAYAIFTILYALYGTILYTTGPLVLALLPTMGLGSLARRYAINFMIFGAWGLIYGVFCRLAITLNINSMAAITGAGNLGGLLTGATAEVLLAAASILFSVCILLIPFLAKRIVEGDLGSTMLTVLGTAAAMAQAAVATASGAAEGFGRTASSGSGAESAGMGSGVPSGAPPAPPPSSGSGQSVSGNTTPQTGPPSGPQQSTGSIGQHRPVNIPHAVGWLAGAAAALGVQGGQRVVQASRGLAARAVTPTRNSGSA
ncbi:MAG: hypothetical protein K2X35_20610 [Bryobacteraceae bacterium]|nr:hypothetical protein [Bryobacteraceae bacterium]